MKKLSYLIMAFATIWAIYGELIYHFYWEDLIVMFMMIAIFLKKGEA